jgi:hypothetical protein
MKTRLDIILETVSELLEAKRRGYSQKDRDYVAKSLRRARRRVDRDEAESERKRRARWTWDEAKGKWNYKSEPYNPSAITQAAAYLLSNYARLRRHSSTTPLDAFSRARQETKSDLESDRIADEKAKKRERDQK